MREAKRSATKSLPLNAFFRYLAVSTDSRERCSMKLAGSIALLFLCVLLMPQCSNAQEKAQPQAASASQSAPASTTAYTLSPDKLAKAKALYELRGKLRIIDTLYSLLVLLALLYLGVAAKYRDWAESVSKYRFVQALIFVPLLLLTLTALSLPLYAYQHSISLQYGLSVQR